MSKSHPNITLNPVKSSQIESVGYDAASKTLAVKFNRGNGAVYHYPGVEEKAWKDLIGAKSIGAHFGQHIKKLPFNKIEPKTK